MSHTITLNGTAGPTDAPTTAYWWEVRIDPAADAVYAATVPVIGTHFLLGSAAVSTMFDIPAGQDWNGKYVRFVVQSMTDGSQIWHSGWTLMTGVGFNNAGVGTPPTYADPLPAVTSITADPLFLVTLIGELGPVTSDLLPNPSIVYWWEIELTTGVFYAISNETTLGSVPSRLVITDTFSVPLNISLSGRMARLAARSVYSYADVWRSSPIVLSGSNFNNVAPPLSVPPPIPPVIPPGPSAAPPSRSVDVIIPRFDPVPVRPALLVRLSNDLASITINRTSDDRGELAVSVTSDHPNVIGLGARTNFMLRDRHLIVPIAPGADGDAILYVTPLVRSHLPGQITIRVEDGEVVAPEDM